MIGLLQQSRPAASAFSPTLASPLPQPHDTSGGGSGGCSINSYASSIRAPLFEQRAHGRVHPPDKAQLIRAAHALRPFLLVLAHSCIAILREHADGLYARLSLVTSTTLPML